VLSIALYVLKEALKYAAIPLFKIRGWSLKKRNFTQKNTFSYHSNLA